MTLRETVHAFRDAGRALGHFNISDSNQLAALAAAAQETSLPVVVGLSEGERAYFPLPLVRAMVDRYRLLGIEMFLNADHTYTLEKAKEAIDAGVDSVVVDGAKLSFEDNVSLTKAVVEYARQSGREVLVEGELGYIGTSSKVLDALPEGAAATEELMTKADELKRFVEQTGVDLVAPAVGNIHGMIKGGQPKLSIDRIAALAATTPSAPLVLHGGSGSSDEEFSASIKAGIAMIHINTELRVLYRNSLHKTLTESPEESTPYKFLEPSVAAMQAYVSSKLSLFAKQ